MFNWLDLLISWLVVQRLSDVDLYLGMMVCHFSTGRVGMVKDWNGQSMAAPWMYTDKMLLVFMDGSSEWRWISAFIHLEDWFFGAAVPTNFIPLVSWSP